MGLPLASRFKTPEEETDYSNSSIIAKLNEDIRYTFARNQTLMTLETKVKTWETTQCWQVHTVSKI